MEHTPRTDDRGSEHQIGPHLVGFAVRVVLMLGVLAALSSQGGYRLAQRVGHLAAFGSPVLACVLIGAVVGAALGFAVQAVRR